jgi:hypothetical protein
MLREAPRPAWSKRFQRRLRGSGRWQLARGDGQESTIIEACAPGALQ